MGLSLNPEKFATGGLQVGEMEVVGALFEIYDFEGKSNKDFADPTVLRLDLKLPDGAEHSEHLSCGPSDRIIPSDDGNEAMGQGDHIQAISKSTTLYLFLDSLLKAGFPASKLESGKASDLAGLRFISHRPPMLDSDGNVKKRKVNGREYDQTYFACSKVISLPGEKAGAKAGKGKAATAAKTTTAAPRPAAAAAAAAAPAPAGNGEYDAQATELVMHILAEAGGTLPLMHLKVKIFPAVKSMEADAKAGILALTNSPEWLASAGFTVDGNTISMG